MTRSARDIGCEDWLVGEQDALPGMAEPTATTRRGRGYLHPIAL